MCYSVQGSCYHYFSVRGLRLRHTCPFMAAFSMRPSLAPWPVSLVLQLCWLGLWGFLCPCPPWSELSGGAGRRRHLGGWRNSFFLLLSYLGVFLGGRGRGCLPSSVQWIQAGGFVLLAQSCNSQIRYKLDFSGKRSPILNLLES